MLQRYSFSISPTRETTKKGKPTNGIFVKNEAKTAGIL